MARTMEEDVMSGPFGPPLAFRLAPAVGLALMMIAAAGGRAAAPSGGRIEVVDPMKVTPLYGRPPFDQGGSATHRRVINRQGNGSIQLDIGYNLYAAGTRLAAPYAYRTDEFCFVPRGRLVLKSGGGDTEMTGGGLMWRPRGAASDGLDVLEDSVTICAMSPARIDADSHRLPAQDVGKWSGDPALRPKLHFFTVETAPRLDRAHRSPGTAILEREMVSTRKDGSKIGVIFTRFRPGGKVRPVGTAEQICWVGKGRIDVQSGGDALIVATPSFFYRPAGVTIDAISASSGAEMLCFSGPARF